MIKVCKACLSRNETKEAYTSIYCRTYQSVCFLIQNSNTYSLLLTLLQKYAPPELNGICLAANARPFNLVCYKGSPEEDWQVTTPKAIN